MTMAINLPVGFANASVQFTGASVPHGAAITWGVGGAGVFGTPTAVAQKIIDLWVANMPTLFSGSLTLSLCHVKFGPMDDGASGDASSAAAGTATGTGSTPNTAMLVRKNTATGGKRGSGRLFHPGVPEESIDSSGNLISAYRTSAQTKWQTFLAALETAGIPMVLLHTFGTYTNAKGEIVTVPSRAPSAVTSLTVETVVGTQRQRLRP
jgi:hypothetical protein